MRKVQLLIALSLVSAILLSCAFLSLASRSRAVQALTERGELENFKEGGGLFMNKGGFVDFEDRILLDEIPSTDFTRGGTYFFGSSTMKWAMMTWDLPPDQRTAIHNFGVGASNHKFNAQLIRYLADHEGMLLPSERVHVVLTCFFTMGKAWRGGYFGNLWTRYGLYRYDDFAGIEPVEMSQLQHLWVTERVRLASFVSENLHRAVRGLAWVAGAQTASHKGSLMPTEEIELRALENANDPNWEQEEPQQIEELRKLIKYLRDQGVRVTVVLMPTRTAYDHLPFPRRYNADVKALVSEDRVPFVDLSRLLGDDEFVDVNHANYAGLLKLHRALMAVAESPPDLPAR
jgi:hypothetical protein